MSQFVKKLTPFSELFPPVPPACQLCTTETSAFALKYVSIECAVGNEGYALIRRLNASNTG